MRLIKTKHDLSKLYDETSGKLFPQLDSQIWNQIWDTMQRDIHRQVREGVLYGVYFSTHLDDCNPNSNLYIP